MNFDEIKIDIQKKSGYVCYEDMPGVQHTWWGESSKFETFKEAAKDVLLTGDIVVFVDTKASKMYSADSKRFF